MISKRSFVLASLIVCLFPSLSWGYTLNFRTSQYSVDLSSASDVGQYLAFDVLRTSLRKNNISFTFGDYNLFPVDSNYNKQAYFEINNKQLTTQGVSSSGVILWPRDQMSNGVCICDYAVICTFTEYNVAPIKSWVYWDYGVISIKNYFGSFYNTPLPTKVTSIVPNVSNSMPVLVSDVVSNIRYFSNSVRVYNLFQTGTRTDISSFEYGTLQEFSFLLGSHLQYWSGSTLPAWSSSNTFSIQSGNLVSQSDLPWQLQYYNAGYNDALHTKPTSALGADTDQGSEPDFSEYYTGHNYLDPDDDWGQPADIGGGSSGAGGEITGFSSGAQGQLTSAGSEALRDYFGSSSDLDQPVLDSTQYTSSPDEIQLDDYWLSDPLQETSDLLPGGASTFRTLVDRLKTPDSSSLPRWTLNFEVNTGSIAGTIWQGVTYTIDFASLKNAYPAIFTTLRTLAVVCMFVSLIIYLIKDNFLLGGNPSAGSEDD